MDAARKSVAIIGAGPVGLAAAAHVLERNMTPIVIEAGPHVGHAIRQWGHVRMFSPWEYNIDRAAAQGMRLNIASGSAVRFEPGQQRTIELLDFAGNRIVHGFRGLVNGRVDSDIEGIL